MKIVPYNKQQKCSPVTLVSGNIQFMRIFTEFPVECHQMTVGWLTTAIVIAFGCCVFGTIGDKANIFIQ